MEHKPCPFCKGTGLDPIDSWEIGECPVCGGTGEDKKDGE